MTRRIGTSTRAASWKNRAFDRRKSKNAPCIQYTWTLEADFGELGFMETPSWGPITQEEADIFKFSCACLMREI